jgi:hypothetical protein
MSKLLELLTDDTLGYSLIFNYKEEPVISQPTLDTKESTDCQCQNN